MVAVAAFLTYFPVYRSHDMTAKSDVDNRFSTISTIRTGATFVGDVYVELSQSLQ